MTSLSSTNRKKLRRSKRSGDADRLAVTIEEVSEKECRLWARSPYGAYGLLSEEECQNKAPALVARAWEKLRKVASQKIRDVMDEYEAELGGPPQFDANGKVDSDAGGNTLTIWRKVPGGFRQMDSGRILVGSKYICRKKRPRADCVVISIMKTLVHELMGHWNRIGQAYRVDSGLSEDDRKGVRKDKAERKADKITDREWGRIRRSTAFEDCVEECEENFTEREILIKVSISEAIEEYLAELE